MADIFDQLETKSGSGMGGDIFDQVGGVRNTPNPALDFSRPARFNNQSMGARAAGVPNPPAPPTNQPVMEGIINATAGKIKQGVERIGADLQHQAQNPPRTPWEHIKAFLPIPSSEQVGGATDIALGVGAMYTPPMLRSLGAALKANPLKTIGGVVGGGAIGWGTRQAAESMGVPEGYAQGLELGTGLATGAALHAVLPARNKLSYFDEAPAMRAFGVKPNQSDALETFQGGLPEIRDTLRQQLPNGVKSWKGPQGSFTKLVAEQAGPATKSRLWSAYDQMAQPFRGRTRFAGDEFVANIRANVPENEIRGAYTDYARNLMARYTGKTVPIEQAEADLHEVNAYLAGWYAKNDPAMLMALRQDTGDVATLNALARGLRKSIYTALDQENGGQVAAELMRKWGDVSEITDMATLLKNPAIQGMGPREAEKWIALATGLAKAKVGYTGSGLNSILRVFGAGEPTVDQAMIKALSEYGAAPRPTPIRPEINISPEDVIGTPKGQPMSPALLERLLGIGRAGAPSAAESAAVLAQEHPPGPSAVDAAKVLQYAPEPGPRPSQWLPSQPTGRPAAEAAQTFQALDTTAAPIAGSPVSPQHPLAGMPGQRALPSPVPGREFPRVEAPGPLPMPRPPAGAGIPPPAKSVISLTGSQAMPNPALSRANANQFAQSFSPEAVAAYAQRNGLTWVEANTLLNSSGARPGFPGAVPNMGSQPAGAPVHGAPIKRVK